MISRCLENPSRIHGCPRGIEFGKSLRVRDVSTVHKSLDRSPPSRPIVCPNVRGPNGFDRVHCTQPLYCCTIVLKNRIIRSVWDFREPIVLPVCGGRVLRAVNVIIPSLGWRGGRKRQKRTLYSSVRLFARPVH